MGKRPLVVHPRNDFMFLAMDQLMNLAAKWRYMYGDHGGVPVVTRAIVGRGWGQGATHSQSLHATFAHFPGLVVLTPASPGGCERPAGQRIDGIWSGHHPRKPRAVRARRRSSRGAEPIPFGKGRIVVDGTDITIVAASLMVHEARGRPSCSPAHGISAEVVDPRSIRPLDEEIILNCIEKTHHLVVADTSWSRYGLAAEVAAVAAEKGWGSLKAPVRRVTPPDCPAPVSKPLEDAFHPNPRSIARACLEVLRSDDALERYGCRRPVQVLGPY